MRWIPQTRDIIVVHEQLVREFESSEDPISPAGVKSFPLLESAQSRPMTSLGDVEKYPDFIEKSAALFHSLVKNHPFHNGNKRTALVTLLTMLYRNDKQLKQVVTDDILYDFVVSVTENTFPREGLHVDDVVKEIAKWIKYNCENTISKLGEMDSVEFCEKCECAGCQIKKSSKSIIVSNASGSVHFSKSTKRLNGNVIRTYLKILGLTAAATGVTMIEFAEGVTAERAQIRRYTSTLSRLAKT